MSESEKLNVVKYLFHRHAINWNSCVDKRMTEITGKRTVQWYRHPDLWELSKEAFEKGENGFFTKVDENGRITLGEPIYVYSLPTGIPEKQFEELFGAWDQKEFLHYLTLRANEAKKRKEEEDLER